MNIGICFLCLKKSSVKNGFSLTQLKYYIKQKHEKELKRSFEELPFYGILIEKLYSKRLDNSDMLHELQFYDELNIVKTSRAFKGFSRSCRVETINSKDS